MTYYRTTIAAIGPEAGDMIAGDRGELQRLAAGTEQARHQRPAGQLADDVAFRGAIRPGEGGHPAPRSARMLPA